MAAIININQIRDEEEGVFCIRDEDGDMKNLQDWNAEDWEQLIDGAFVMMAKEYGCSKYDLLADFMHQVISMEDD